MSRLEKEILQAAYILTKHQQPVTLSNLARIVYDVRTRKDSQWLYHSTEKFQSFVDRDSFLDTKRLQKSRFYNALRYPDIDRVHECLDALLTKGLVWFPWSRNPADYSGPAEETYALTALGHSQFPAQDDRAA